MAISFQDADININDNEIIDVDEIKKEIEDADCYEIVNCSLGYIKKKLHPEVKNWDEAVSVCAKCGNN